jgi:hypothetical protein
MKNNILNKLIPALALSFSLLFTGCSMTGTTSGTQVSDSAAENTSAPAESAESKSDASSENQESEEAGQIENKKDHSRMTDRTDGNTDAEARTGKTEGRTDPSAETGQTDGNAASATDMDKEWYSDRDLEQSPDTSGAKTLKVSDGQNISITEEGVYILTGTAKECTVTVDTPEAKVQLVLNGVSITNTEKPAVYVLNADKCFVTSADGSKNNLKVTGTFTEDADHDEKTDAVIYATSDLTLNGKGKLTIESTDNGITSKDELTVTGGSYDITASGHGLESNDSIAVKDGTFTISAKEGMESTYVRIDGGTFDISADDDGLNATADSEKYSVAVEINGGNLNIRMGAGDTDGIDSNGDLTINGGEISITGNSSFDYDGTGTLNGGTVIVNGEEITELPNQVFGGRNGMGPEGPQPRGERPF